MSGVALSSLLKAAGRVFKMRMSACSGSFRIDVGPQRGSTYCDFFTRSRPANSARCRLAYCRESAASHFDQMGCANRGRAETKRPAMAESFGFCWVGKVRSQFSNSRL